MKITKFHLLSFLLLTLQAFISFLLIKLVSTEYELFKFNTENSLDINILMYGIAIFITPIITVVILNRLKNISDCHQVK